MRFTCLLAILMCGMAMAQTQPSSSSAPAKPAAPAQAPAAKPATPAAPAAETVAPDAPVITVAGVCDQPTANASDCKTVITRAQFEKMANAMNPNMPATLKKSFANTYARWLVMDQEARKRGLEKSERLQETMRIMKMQLLAQELQKNVQEEAGKHTPEEIEGYYKANPTKFEEFTLERIYIPKIKPGEKPPESEAAKKKDEDEKQAMANKIYGRAKAGEDFDKLEKEIYDGMKNPPPTTKIGTMRRGSLPLAHDKVFEMKAGQISELYSDNSGFYIYKLVSRQELPLDKVKPEIERILLMDKMKTQMDQLTKLAVPELNEAYFAAPGSQASHEREEEEAAPPKPGAAVKPAAKTTAPKTAPAPAPQQK